MVAAPRDAAARCATPGPTAAFHWDVDFFKADDGRTYFALAEVEMPETRDRAAAAAAQPGAASARGWRQHGDPRFASKRLADRSHAERLLADMRAKGRIAVKIARIDSQSVKVPFTFGGSADGLWRPQLDDQQHPAGAGRDRHRPGRLGRGLLLRLHRRRAGGACTT